MTAGKPTNADSAAKREQVGWDWDHLLEDLSKQNVTILLNSITICCIHDAFGHTVSRR